MTAPPIVEARGLEKAFATHTGPYPVIRGVDLTVHPGEHIALVGRSGSGKSTLLSLLAGLDRPDRGTLTVAGTVLADLDEPALARWRGATVGIVFQFFQLLPTLTAVENVALPMDLRGEVAASERRTRALALLDRVGLTDHATKYPAALSGGEQQRVAIARALANDPPLLVADEPTGNLDSETAAEIHAVFEDQVRAGRTVIEITHDRVDERPIDRVLTLVDGVWAAA